MQIECNGSITVSYEAPTEINQIKKVENPPPFPINKANYEEEERFIILQSTGLIDNDGIATTEFKEQKLQAITEETKEYILDIANQRISPKAKDLRSLGQPKESEVVSAFNLLFEKYSYALPFTFDKIKNTLQFHTNFSFAELVYHVRMNISIDDEIEMIGGGVPEVVGPEYFINRLISWAKQLQGISKKASAVNDWDFWIQTASLEKVIDTIIDFFLYRILIIDHIALEDHKYFRFLIRETAFKNLCDTIENKVLMGFANANDIDFDITFSTSKMAAPFSYGNGLIIGIPKDFNLEKEIVPYTTKEVNPVQCITDQFADLLNGPCIINPKTRVEWLLSSWTKGKRLFCTSWQEEIAKPGVVVNNTNLSENLFAKMVETINRFLLMHKMGYVQEAAYYFKSFAEALQERDVFEEEPSYLILSSLFKTFSDPIKGLYYLYLISLYTLPLETDHPFSAGFARNGSFECLALKMPFKGDTRTLYFSAPFDSTSVSQPTKEELAVVDAWFSYFASREPLSKDSSSYQPFLNTSLPKESFLSLFSACEQALFGSESPSYDLFFDVASLTQIVHAPIFSISRINIQFSLRGLIGFDLMERAIKEKSPTASIAWAFIQDSMRLAPISLRRTAPSLIKDLAKLVLPQEIEGLICQWIALVIPNDTEMALALLRYGESYILSAKGCCHILNSCTTHFRTHEDYQSFELWLTRLLDCLKTEKKCAADALKINTIIENTKLLTTPTILSHSTVPKLLTDNQLKTAYAVFLNGTLTRAIKANCPIRKEEAISLYQNYFPKLKLSSSEERAATSKAIQLFCRDLPSDTTIESFFKNFFDLARSILEAEKRPDLAKNALDILLWKPDNYVKLKGLDRWKERLFEIAIDTIHALLETSPKETNKQQTFIERLIESRQTGMRLTLAGRMIENMQEGNARRSRLIPLVEKMLFSPLSMCSAPVYIDNLKYVKVLCPLIDKHSALYPECCYKTTLIFDRAEWSDSKLAIKKKLHLASEVINFQIATKQPLALEILFDIMHNAFSSLFGKNDDLRISTIVKIIEAAFSMPYERTHNEPKSHFTTSMVGPDCNTIVDIPLLKDLVNKLFTETSQRLIHNDKDIATKGYPIIQTLTERLVALCISDEAGAVNTEEFADILLHLWKKAAQLHIFASEKQYIDTLNLFITPVMLNQIVETESWKELFSSYIHLLNSKTYADKGLDLFEQLIKTLLKAEDMQTVNKGKELLNEGMKQGIYKNTLRKLGTDTELMLLLKRTT